MTRGAVGARRAARTRAGHDVPRARRCCGSWCCSTPSGSTCVRYDGYDHPGVGWRGDGGAGGVDGLRGRGRTPHRPAVRPLLLVADLVVAVGGDRAARRTSRARGFNATLPGFWVMGVVLAWAILLALGRRADGRRASSRVADLGDPRGRSPRRPTATSSCSILGGAIVGFLSGLLQQMAAQRDRAERAAAAAAERQRLARVVHDGVLQVLALVQRRGAELGPDGASSAGWPASRRCGCARWCSRTPATWSRRSATRTSPSCWPRCRPPQVHVAVPGHPGDAAGRARPAR